MSDELVLTNLEKIYWPNEGYTKRDLLDYYRKVYPFIFPYLDGRPQSLNRFPNGINGENFYQKNLKDSPEWLKKFEDYSPEANRTIHYAICRNLRDLLYLVNLGCITLNVWNSNISKPDYPDYMVFDLDPENTSFEAVRKTAFELKAILDQLGIKAYLKTSGKRGLHIYISTKAKYSYDKIRDLAHIIAIATHLRLGEITSLERRPNKRQRKVYIDYLQNRKGATMASPYSVRAVGGAQVSTPITWDELKKGALPEDFVINNTLGRLAEKGDLWENIFNEDFDYEKAITNLAHFDSS